MLTLTQILQLYFHEDEDEKDPVAIYHHKVISEHSYIEIRKSSVRGVINSLIGKLRKAPASGSRANVGAYCTVQCHSCCSRRVVETAPRILEEVLDSHGHNHNSDHISLLAKCQPRLMAPNIPTELWTHIIYSRKLVNGTLVHWDKANAAPQQPPKNHHVDRMNNALL